jgi:protein-L-isoaspartate O-methyltransferase
MTDWEHATSIYNRFRSLPGSEHIASRYAIYGLIRVCRRKKPESVLEIGTGIGTLTHTLIEVLASIHSNGFQLIAIESNEFCLGQLRNNLREQMNRVHLYNDIAQVPSDCGFDLVVTDGGSQQDDRYFLELNRGGVIFVEGDRSTQRRTIERAVSRRRFLKSEARTLRKKQGGSGFEVGYSLFWLEPSMRDRLSSLRFRLQTPLVYRLRKLTSVHRG